VTVYATLLIAKLSSPVTRYGSILCSLTLLPLLLAFGMPACRVSTEAPFPMSSGTYWIYRGTVRWTHAGSDQVSDAPITWRTEIRRVIQHGDVHGIVISGFPFDSAWADDQPKISDSLLIESKGKFYFIGDEHFQQAVQRLEQSSDSLDGLFSDNDLVLEWPLRKGQKYCDADGMARLDGRYCWVVASSRKVSLSGVAGVESGEHDEFVLEYGTNPDNTQFTFVPEVGITKYEYHHHGTVADTELRLVEFHQSVDGRK
jgi:hypothetical protein